ncbi:competence protein ComK [Fredinandcohnia sp. 179-A 10B2 NHS]|uniref:competence protein ComK n=1 Tax=Fredinandcohnia sp. 179-A 10B2 NHS TaxID=3235176 RepID=UPI0039A333E9
MKEYQVFEEYQICETTEALEPFKHEKYCTKITDRNGVFYTSKSITQLLIMACYEGASTLEGSRKAVTYTLRFNQKTPLPINIRKNIYAFPTCSPDDPDCTWIFVSHILGTISLDRLSTLIRFKSNNKITVAVSEYTINEQRKRTTLVIMRFSGFDKIS